MAMIVEVGRTPAGDVFFLIQDDAGDPHALIATDDAVEELARDLLDFVGREYCLPLICDHLGDRRS
jgi:hypothetical protein